MRHVVTGLALASLVGCSWGEQQLVKVQPEKTSALSLTCYFAAKNQIFETSVLLDEKQQEGSLETFDTRHKIIVETVTTPVLHENGFWILKTRNKSDSVATSREHRIGQSNFVYERHTFIQMGKTPPLITLDQGQCSTPRTLHRKGQAVEDRWEQKSLVDQVSKE